MRFNRERGKAIAVYSVVLALSYLACGLLEVLAGFGLVEMMLIPPDVFGGVMLVIIATVFLSGIRGQWEEKKEGFSFLAVGILLATVFFGVYLLIIAANCLGHLLQFEDWLQWSWMNNLRPCIWLFPLALPGAYLIFEKKQKG